MTLKSLQKQTKKSIAIFIPFVKTKMGDFSHGKIGFNHVCPRNVRWLVCAAKNDRSRPMWHCMISSGSVILTICDFHLSFFR